MGRLWPESLSMTLFWTHPSCLWRGQEVELQEAGWSGDSRDADFLIYTHAGVGLFGDADAFQ